MLVLYLMAVLAISACNVAGQFCTLKLTPNAVISGGDVSPYAGLGSCQDFCLSTAECQSLDFDHISHICHWHKTQSGLQPGQDIDHYDKICQDIRDPECLKTNYQGPVSDLWSAPNGVTWNFQIAHFGFDWPQTVVVSTLSPSILVFIEEISFESSDNLDYFRVVITKNNGPPITTQAIGPNDHTTTVSGANDVKKVDFYLAPVDFQSNASLNNISLKACAGIGPLRECIIFNLVKDLIEAASLGLIRLGGTSGTFSASVAQEYPYVDLDLNCAGFGTVGFNGIIFDGAQNINYVVISVWDGDTAVPIVNIYGDAGDTFSDPQNIKFASSVRGNRIRTTIIPSAVPDQGISGSIGFSKYSIFAID